jgi:trehalose 6-phosphate phosphatase
LRPEVRSHLMPFLQAVAEAPQAVLFLDYDGTLAPFQVKRDQAYPYPGAAAVLQEIVRSGQTRLVVVTGREAGEIQPLLDIHPTPEVWGCHGLERLRTDGIMEMLPLSKRTRNGLSEAEHWVDHQQLRDIAEFKRGGIAIHWRGLNEMEKENIRARMMLGWRPIAKDSGLALLEFDGGLEILAKEAGKGDAVRALLEEVSPETPAAYLGDDATDESAFRAMEGRGISILVRPTWRQTAAQSWLKPPQELLEFLDLWLKASLKHAASGDGAAAAVSG